MHEEVSSFVKNTWHCFHEDEKSNTLRVRSAGNVSCIIIRELREDHAEVDNNMFHVVSSFDTVYMLNYPDIYSRFEREREREAVNMQGTVYLSKIVVSHKNNSSNLSLTAIDHVG